jgi:hypothetical protein
VGIGLPRLRCGAIGLICPGAVDRQTSVFFIPPFVHGGVAR